MSSSLGHRAPTPVSRQSGVLADFSRTHEASSALSALGGRAAGLLPSSPHVLTERNGAVRRLYLSTAVWRRLPSDDRRRVYEQCIDLGIEAWGEGDQIVFHRADLPLHASARKAHAARCAFLIAGAA